MALDEIQMAGGNKAATGINLLAGIWLFVSPWVYGYDHAMNAWNGWIIGFLIALFAAVRLGSPMQSWLSWINCALGVWTFFTPWIYGFTGDTPRFVNSLVVGVIVFVLGLLSAKASVHPMRPTAPPAVRA